MNRIKEVLDAKGISQTELANRLGKTFNMVNLYTKQSPTTHPCSISNSRDIK